MNEENLFSETTERWMGITQQYAHSADDVMLIDIHTGFGDYGDPLETGSQ